MMAFTSSGATHPCRNYNNNNMDDCDTKSTPQGTHGCKPRDCTSFSEGEFNVFAYLQENVSISVEQTDKFQTLISVISLLLRHPGGLCLFVPMHCDQDLLGITFTHAQSHGQPIQEQNLTIKVSGY